MGKKIEIRKIDNSNRCQVTFSKRRNNLIKKAHQISILCDIDFALIVFSASGKIYKFSNQERLEDVIQRYLNLPPEKRFHLTRNVQRSNTSCLCHKAEKLKELDHIRGDENKLLHLENLIKGLALQIKEATVGLEVLNIKLKDYEPNPQEVYAPSQLMWMERNLRASLQLVKDKSNKLMINNKLPSSSLRKPKAQKKKKKERPSRNRAIFRNVSESTNELNHQGAVKQNQLQKRHDPWTASYRSSGSRPLLEGSFRELLAQVSGASVRNDGLPDTPTNYALNNPNFQFGSSSSVPLTQMPPTYLPVQHQSVIGDLNTLGTQNQQPRVPGSFTVENSEKETPVEIKKYPPNWIVPDAPDEMFFENLNCEIIASSPVAHSQANPNEENWIADYTFDSYQSSNDIVNATPPLSPERLLPLEGCEFFSVDTPIAGATFSTITTNNIRNNTDDYEPDFTEFFAIDEYNNSINKIENSSKNNNTNNDSSESPSQVNPLPSTPTDMYSSNNLYQEAGKGDATSSSAGTWKDPSWNTDNLDWASELILEDLDISLD